MARFIYDTLHHKMAMDIQEQFEIENLPDIIVISTCYLMSFVTIIPVIKARCVIWPKLSKVHNGRCNFGRFSYG